MAPPLDRILIMRRRIDVRHQEREEKGEQISQIASP
jgi:hypothetical protein